MVDQVSDVQENFRGLLRMASDQSDKTLEEEALYNVIEKYGEDAVVNMAVATMEVFYKNSDPSMIHLIRAVHIMDHLDTLGMEVRFKK